MNNFLQKLLLTTIPLFPLLGATNNFGYEQIKVLFFILSITLIGFLWRGRYFRWTLISKVAGFFILILLITSLMGIDAKSSLLGGEPYFQGWILYSYLYLFYLMVKTFKIELKNYALVLSVSALLVSALAIKDWILLNLFNLPISTYAGRVVSTFGQPNFYAGFLLLALPFSYFILKNPNRRLQFLGWGSGMTSFVGIMVSYSRSAILLSFILFILALIDQLKTTPKPQRHSRVRGNLWIPAFAGMTIIIAIFLSIHFSSGFVWKEFLKPLSINDPDLTNTSVESRVYIWPQAFKVGLQNPFIGFGLENIGKSFSNYFEKNKHALFEENLKISPVLISLKDLYLDRTHNYVLDLFLFSGIFGVGGWLILAVVLFKKTKNQTLLMGLITYLIWVQFQNQSVVHLVYFWLLAGLIDNNT